MKRINLSVLFWIILISLQTVAQQESGYLQLRGTTLKDNTPIDGVTIDVYQKGEKINSILSWSGGKFNIKLELNNEYILEFSKTDLVTKRLEFKTDVPPNEIGIYNFKFSVELFTMVDGLDVSLLDKPIGKFTYDDQLGEFNYDEEYTAVILGQLKSLLKEYEKLRKKAYNEIIAQADTKFTEKSYEEALYLYEKALDLDPYDLYPEDQIMSIDRILNKEKNVNKLYQNAIEVADQSFTKKDYKAALAYYNKALTYKPEETYPVQKIDEINLILKNLDSDKDKLAEIEAQIKQLIQDADAAFKQKEYTQARDLYAQALNLKPSMIYPANQIAAIDKILADLALKDQNAAAIQKAYDDAIAQADKEFGNRQYNVAKQFYQKALTIKSKETYPKDKINEIDKLLAQLEAAEKEYNEVIVKADNHFKNTRYTDAKPLYEKCLSLKPGEEYPARQIDEINKKLGLEKEIQAKYAGLIVKADEQFGKDRLPDAKALYQEALNIKPTEVYPKQKINDIDRILAERALALKKQQETDQQYNDLITKADNSFIIKQYNEALMAYQSASNVKPAENYPKNRIAEINQILTVLKEKQKQYQNIILQADRFYKDQKWQEAREQYAKALEILPDETYPRQKIDDIDQKLMAMKIADEKLKALETAYKTAIRRADSLFNLKSYPLSKSEYENALTHKPNEKYPRVKIDEIDKLLAALDALNKQYDQFITEADNLFNNRNYQDAKGKYEKAAGLKPQESYPRDKIKEIDQLLAAIKKAAEDKTEQENMYKQLIKNADKSFKSNLYEPARADYLAASNIKPDETYPKEKLAEIDRILSKLKSDEDAYKQAMTDGETAFSAQNYSMSKSAYLRALAVYPDRPEPKLKIAEIDKILADIDAKLKAYNETIALADVQFAGQNYENARNLYQKAGGIKSDENYPKQKIAEIDNILADLKKQADEKARIENQYKNLIAKADNEFNSKQYINAKSSYTEASLVKPEETYPRQRLTEIDQLLAKQKADQEAYDKAMADGNTAFNQKNYPLAKSSFTRALTVYPEKPEPRQKIDEIDRIVADLEAKNKAYNQAIASADQLFNSKNYDNARTAYEKALQIKPDETYPKQKMAEIDQLVASLKKAAEDKAKLDGMYNELITKADKSLSQSLYDQARADYFAASNLKPEQTYPKQKITEIDQITAKIKQTKEAYDKAMNDGEMALAALNYAQAKTFFANAASLLPDRPEPKQKIAEIDKILADIDLKNKSYSDAVSQGDKAFAARDYEKSRLFFQKALELKPTENYPKQKMVEIDQLLADIKKAEKEKLARDKEYSDAIIQGDNLFNAQDFTNAKVFYQKALNMKPEQPYPKQKIAEIDQKLRDIKAVATATAPKPQKTEDFDYNGEERKSEFINELAKLYPEGVTVENYDKPKKKIKRVIVNHKGIAREYIEVQYTYGTYYFRNGQNISKYVFLSETKE